MRQVWLTAAATLLAATFSAGVVEAAPPAIALSATRVTFAAQPVGVQSAATKSVTIKNQTKLQMSLSLTMSGSAFAIQTNSCSSPLPPHGKCVVGLSFMPTGLGKQAGALTITPIGNFTKGKVALSGVGAAPKVSGLNIKSAPPYTVVAMNGSGFTPLAKSIVSFGSKTVNPINVLPVAVTPASVLVSVPPFVDPVKHSFGTATVDVQLSEGFGAFNVKPKAVKGFIIQAPSVSSALTAGTITLGVLQGAVQAFNQDASQLPPSVASQLAALSSANQQLESILSSAASGTAGDLGTVNGSSISVGNRDLQNVDKLVLGVMQALSRQSSGVSATRAHSADATAVLTIQAAASALLALAANPAASQQQIAQATANLINASTVSSTDSAAAGELLSGATIGTLGQVSGSPVPGTLAASYLAISNILTGIYAVGAPVIAQDKATGQVAEQALSQATTVTQTVAPTLGGAIGAYSSASSDTLAPVQTQVQQLLGQLYVANANNNTVTVYTAGTNGNVTPIRSIGGPHTGLAQPAGATLDPQGKLYVANSQNGSITVYGPAASGDATPSMTINAPSDSSGADHVDVCPFPLAVAANGQPVTFTATAVDTSDNPLPSQPPFIWSVGEGLPSGACTITTTGPQTAQISCNFNPFTCVSVTAQATTGAGKQGTSNMALAGSTGLFPCPPTGGARPHPCPP